MACLFDCCSCWTTVAVLILGIIFGVKLYLKWTTGMCKSTRRLDGKTVIVTGANSGIGKETALDMARRRARVIMACRNMEKANQVRDEIIQKTGNTDVVVRELDLTSLKSVRDFAAEINKTEQRLDVLINNAGVGGSSKRHTEDGLIQGMQANHFGPFLLTNLLVDLLKKSSPSRIVFVSSRLHGWANLEADNLNFENKWLSSQQVYNCSKLANVLNSNELARRLDKTGVTVNSLHPGLVYTEIFNKLPFYILFIFNVVLKNFIKSAYEGAQTTIYLAVSEEVEGVTGKYFADCQEIEAYPAALDTTLAKKVWERSEALVKNTSKKSK